MHRGLFLCTFIYIRAAFKQNIHGILIFPPEPPSLHNGRSRCSYQHHAPGRWRYSHETFARQMMSSYWFGDVEDYKRFSGDTLREYKRYFSDYDYTQWDNDDFWSRSSCSAWPNGRTLSARNFRSYARKWSKPSWGGNTYNLLISKIILKFTSLWSTNLWTLFFLRTFASEIKTKGIMGCIVNGSGEMADADYSYVGAGPNKVSLYRKQVCVEKNIPQEVAVEHLLALIDADKK